MAHYQVASTLHPRVMKTKMKKRSGQLSSFSRWSGIFGTVTTTKTMRSPKKDENPEETRACNALDGETKTSIVIYPSPWIVKLGLGFAAQADISWSSNGWKLMQQTWRIIPRSSPIFRACNEGDTQTVKSRLAE